MMSTPPSSDGSQSSVCRSDEADPRVAECADRR